MAAVHGSSWGGTTATTRAVPRGPKKNYKRPATRGTQWGSAQKKAKGGMQSTVSTRSKAANPATNTRSKMGKLN
ncbi:hypothetical protein ZWY2020_040855 [Hordeum vulgare]|nr:hypothetical protein ZWY2020_040855 [Hordeum vulgare]